MNIGGDRKTYSPIKGGQDTFWGVDKTAIPAAPAPVPAKDPSEPDVTPPDKWSYARVNPEEHFAEVYAKAVHVPVQLHDELVVQPAAQAKQATDLVDQQKAAIEAMERAPAPDASRIAAMRSKLTALESDKEIKLRAEKQRGEQFSVMRNDVFHTNDATAASKARLEAKQINPDKLREFEAAAAAASTPEQIQMLEMQAAP